MTAVDTQSAVRTSDQENYRTADETRIVDNSHLWHAYFGFLWNSRLREQRSVDATGPVTEPVCFESRYLYFHYLTNRNPYMRHSDPETKRCLLNRDFLSLIYTMIISYSKMFFVHLFAGYLWHHGWRNVVKCVKILFDPSHLCSILQDFSTFGGEDFQWESSYTQWQATDGKYIQ